MGSNRKQFKRSVPIHSIRGRAYVLVLYSHLLKRFGRDSSTNVDPKCLQGESTDCTQHCLSFIICKETNQTSLLSPISGPSMSVYFMSGTKRNWIYRNYSELPNIDYISSGRDLYRVECFDRTSETPKGRNLHNEKTFTLWLVRVFLFFLFYMCNLRALNTWFEFEIAFFSRGWEFKL